MQICRPVPTRLLPGFFMALLFLMLTLTACTSRNVGEAGLSEKGDMPLKTVTTSKPSWLDQPLQDGVIGVVGWAPEQRNGGIDVQTRIALIKARKALAELVAVEVDAEITQSNFQHGQKATQHTTSNARLQSRVTMTLEKAYLAEKWLDPSTKVLHIWFRVPR